MRLQKNCALTRLACTTVFRTNSSTVGSRSKTLVNQESSDLSSNNHYAGVSEKACRTGRFPLRKLQAHESMGQEIRRLSDEAEIGKVDAVNFP